MDVFPDSFGQNKRRNGENGAGNQRFTDRRGRPREVLFKDRPSENAQKRHRDNRCRERRGNGHTGSQSDIRICRTKQHRKNNTDKECLEGKFLHICVFRHIRLVLSLFLFVHTPPSQK